MVVNFTNSAATGVVGSITAAAAGIILSNTRFIGIMARQLSISALTLSLQQGSNTYSLPNTAGYLITSKTQPQPYIIVNGTTTVEWSDSEGDWKSIIYFSGMNSLTPSRLNEILENGGGPFADVQAASLDEGIIDLVFFNSSNYLYAYNVSSFGGESGTRVARMYIESPTPMIGYYTNRNFTTISYTDATRVYDFTYTYMIIYA